MLISIQIRIEIISLSYLVTEILSETISNRTKASSMVSKSFNLRDTCTHDPKSKNGYKMRLISELSRFQLKQRQAKK